ASLLSRKDGFMKRIFALSVGIGTYAQLHNLKCPPHDAKDFVAVLQSGSEQTHIKLITDKQATKASIINELQWLSNNAGPDDTAMFFFSGHGGRQTVSTDDRALLCPVNASLLDPEETCISSQELSHMLNTIEAERLIVLLDTCYSGGMREARYRHGDVSAGLDKDDVISMLDGSGRVILAASRPDQQAWELHGMRNGLFTNYLLRALRGEAARIDGSIWVSDVFGFVSRGVRQHGCQSPFQRSVGEDFMMLKQKHRKPLLARPEMDQRPLRQSMLRVYNREELSILCRDLGFTIDDLPGRTLETQIMDLIDHCQRHELYECLLARVKEDRPNLAVA
ncbi:MAG TPA: caspase family protein, partial [Anaerolineales bacterium]|nr:caspase family protein [Anaerolineales bacterium]